MKAIVASSNLWPTPLLASKVLDIVSREDPSTMWAVRGQTAGPSGYVFASPVEEMVHKIGLRLSVWVQPYAVSSTGSNAGWLRDKRLVGDADEVYAFFDPGRVMDGGSGHVVTLALQMDRKVTAYTLNDFGNVVEIGSEEGYMSVNDTEGFLWR